MALSLILLAVVTPAISSLLSHTRPALWTATMMLMTTWRAWRHSLTPTAMTACVTPSTPTPVHPVPLPKHYINMISNQLETMKYE